LNEFSFLPHFPPAFNNVVVVALILLLGLAFGELFRRVLMLPRISGYVVAGLVVGPGTFGLLDTQMFDDARLLFNIALGLILFELGSRLDLQWLRRNRWLLASSIAESALSFALVFIVLLALQVPILQAAIAGAIGMASGAPVLLLIIHSQRADGPLTDRAINHTALNNVFAVVAVTMLLSFLHLEYRAGAYLVILHPLYLLLGSMLLGYLFSVFLVGFARWLGKREDLQFILLVAMLIALLALGVMARNRDTRRDLLPVEFGPTAQALFVILFVMTGAAVTLGDLAAGAWAGLAYAVARLAGKVLGVVSFAQLSGLRIRKAALLGLTLTPMSAIAIVLVDLTAHLYPAFGQRLAAVVMSAVLMLELSAPLITQLALRNAGEAHPEAPWS
jgi:Kef-type K+ transport system membrane component KefB